MMMKAITLFSQHGAIAASFPTLTLKRGLQRFIPFCLGTSGKSMIAAVTKVRIDQRYREIEKGIVARQDMLYVQMWLVCRTGARRG